MKKNNKKEGNKIYGYTAPELHKWNGWIKVGESKRPNTIERIIEQGREAKLIKIVVIDGIFAQTITGEWFSDRDVRNVLERAGYRVDQEWVEASEEIVRRAISSLINKEEFHRDRPYDFKPRKEQEDFINYTSKYFLSPSHPLKKFLWNAKMRFGKTCTTYWLSEKMKFKRVLVTTFKPAVSKSWFDDLNLHNDFVDWKYIDNSYTNEERKKILNSDAKVVCFISLQDLLGSTESEVKEKNKIIHNTEWDLVVFDEYHFGAWRDKTSFLFNKDKDVEEKQFQTDDENKDESEIEEINAIAKESENIEKQIFNIKNKYKLYLSGTPYRAIGSGEFPNEAILDWTYEDEQRAKALHASEGSKSQYADLPSIHFYTYSLLPKLKKEIGQQGNDKFLLNEFFSANKNSKGNYIKPFSFKYHNQVLEWLKTICLEVSPLSIEDIKKGAKDPIMPFGGSAKLKDGSIFSLQQKLLHTIWLLPNVSSCEAMYNLLKANASYFPRCKIVRAYGDHCGCGADAIEPVCEAIGSDGTITTTITLTCGKLTTGVTIKEWSGILMLSDCTSAEKYMQAAFRVQSPWRDKTKKILKNECYVIDFSPNRTLMQIKNYSVDLNSDTNKELDHKRTSTEKISDFLEYTTIHHFDGHYITKLNPDNLIQTAILGTTTSNLAKRFRDHRLINLSNDIIHLINADDKIKKILDKIDVFRKHGDYKISDMENDVIIIDKPDPTPTGPKGPDGNSTYTPEQLAELKAKKEAQKRLAGARQLMKDKIGAFLCTLPVFMYINKFREEKLEDVIEFIEPDLFEKVSGLSISDFKLLKDKGFFDITMMDDTVLLFRVLEEPSLQYLGIVRNADREWGLFSATIKREDVEEIKKELLKD